MFAAVIGRLVTCGDVPDHSTFSKKRHGRFRDSAAAAVAPAILRQAKTTFVGLVRKPALLMLRRKISNGHKATY